MRFPAILGLAAAVLAAAPCAPALADVVHLKSGKKFEGTVEDKGDTVVVRLESGSRFTFNREDVDRIELKTPPWETYEQKAAGLKPGDAAGHLELAKWCRDSGLSSRMQKELDLVIKAEPDNAEARALLGHEKVDGKWLSREEALKARGFVQVDGVWLGPKEYEAHRQKVEAEEKARKASEALMGKFEALADRDAAKAEAARKHFTDQGNQALPTLAWAAMNMKDSRVRVEAVKLINAIGVPEKSVVSGWLARIAWQDPSNEVLTEVTKGIRERKDEIALTLLVYTASSENAYRRRAAAALRMVGDTRAYRALIGALVGASSNNLPGQMGMNLQALSAMAGQAGVSQTGHQLGEVLPAADSLELISGQEHRNDVAKWLKWVDEQERAPGGAVVTPK
ncbi:MAG TPA: hypothetical protein PK280_07505 [Planctomycetota bacterium]|nr:hypothetical protein [Planctomycetota bacterium]